MTLRDAAKLKPGSKVWWNDPDDGICSRFYTIKTIKIKSGFVSIQDVNDD